jgi:hypothetical protein
MTTTKETPQSVGMAVKSCSRASWPPADAPMATTRQGLAGAGASPTPMAGSADTGISIFSDEDFFLGGMCNTSIVQKPNSNL